MEHEEFMKQLLGEWDKIQEAENSEHMFLNEAQYWGTLGAGIVLYALDTKKFLLSLRSKYVNEPGTWGIIGGALDEGETDPKQGAIREFHEEIGIHVRTEIELISVYQSPEKNEKGENLFKYYTYAFKIPRELPELETKKYDWETERCRWFSLNEIGFLKNLHFGVRALLRNGSLEKLTKG